MNGKNIVLIGMPASGKSTLGVLLAKSLGMNFVDTDIIIQGRTDHLLQEIIDSDGIDVFLKIEENILSSLDFSSCVIATGGSAVLSEKAMENLKRNGVIVYLKVDFNEIERRLTDIKTRGVALKNGESLLECYNERRPLYEKYSDLTIECGESVESSVNSLVGLLKKNIL